MTASQRLHDRVLLYACKEIHNILFGGASYAAQYPRLLQMVCGCIDSGIITQDEGDTLRGEAKMALDNAFSVC